MDGRAAQEGRIPLRDKVGMLEPKKGAILQQPPEPPSVAVIVAEQHHHLQALDGLEELDARCERTRAPGGGAGARLCSSGAWLDIPHCRGGKGASTDSNQQGCEEMR